MLSHCPIFFILFINEFEFIDFVCSIFLLKDTIKQNFFLLLSTIETRKNIINTILAYKNLYTKKEKR